MKRIIGWFVGLGIVIGILGSSTFVLAAPEQISGVANPCIEQAEKTVCTFAIKPWGPDFKGVYGYSRDALGKDVDWKADSRVQVYSKRTEKSYPKTNEAMLALQTGDLVIITKSKPAPQAVVKITEPAVPADKVIVFKSGDVPHTLALVELGDAAAWSLAGVRFFHPTRDEEFTKTDEATRRYPVGTRMVIAHELVASRTKGFVGVESKATAGDRKIVMPVPVTPPKATEKMAEKIDPPRAAFVLPIPDSAKGSESVKPAAENPPPSVPNKSRVEYDAWLVSVLTIAIQLLWVVALSFVVAGLWTFVISPIITERRVRRQDMSYVSQVENDLDEGLSFQDRRRGMEAFYKAGREFCETILRQLSLREQATVVLTSSGGYIPPTDSAPNRVWLEIRVSDSKSSPKSLRDDLRYECDKIILGGYVPRADWFECSGAWIAPNGHDEKSRVFRVAFDRRVGLVRILSSAPKALPAASQSHAPI